MLIRAFTLFAITGVAGLAISGGGPSPGMALGMRLIEAMKAGNADAVAAFYTKDAVLYTATGGPIKGRDAIRKDFAQFLTRFKVVEAKVLDSKYATAGSVCYGGGVGEMVVRPKSGGAEMTITMRFTDVQRKLNGKWLYAVDHMSVVPPAPKE